MMGAWKQKRFVVLAALCCVASAAHAQQPPVTTAPTITEGSEEEKNSLLPPPVAKVAPVSSVPSIFFTPTEREAIALAKKQFLERSSDVESEADLLDQLQGIKSAVKKEEDLQEKFYSQFYLETIIYHTPTDWTVWVKDGEVSKKYTQETVVTPETPLKVVSLDKEDATFEWKPRGWQQVQSNYKEGTPNISLDKTRQMVIFTLRVNQIIQSKDMVIKEGYLPPVATTAGAAAGAGAPGGKTAPNATSPNGAATGSVPPSTSGKPAPTVLELYKSLEPANK